jgi:uncharacterized cupredoxin-like copper-binding protein
MIMRLFLILGLILLGGTGYFIVVQVPPAVQASPAVGDIVRLREEGIIPQGTMAENEELEHDIFDVPPEDEAMIEAAAQNMDMGDMDMGTGTSMGGMDMGTGTSMGGMDMGTGTTSGGMNMATDTGAATTMGGMNMATDTGAAMSPPAPVSEEEAARLMMGQMAGLIVTRDGAFDREIQLSMSEWTFSDLSIDAQAGERIKFTVRNDGNILHEFMFMDMARMQGVAYRAERADWNLLEHEALFEQSLLLPGQEITFVAEVVRPGTWMFMCMLPFHMQMGMMGQLSTPGMAMEM